MLKKFINGYTICILGGIAVSTVWSILQNNGFVVGAIFAVSLGTAIWFVLWVVEKIISKKHHLEIHSMYQSQSESNDDMVELIKKAKEIDILTIRGLGIIGLNDAVLRKPIRSIGEKELTIRVFMLSPTSNYAQKRATEIGESYDVFKQALDLGISYIRNFKEETHHKVRIYFYDRQPCWRIIRIDNWYFVSVFDEQTEGHRANVYRIDETKRGTLGRALKRYIESMVVESKQDKSTNQNNNND